VIWLWLLLAIPVLWFAKFVYRITTWRNDYVVVRDDGSIRDVTPDEQAHLEEGFLPADGDRPYTKTRYRQRTPDGKIGGFLERRDVPRRLRRRSP